MTRPERVQPLRGKVALVTGASREKFSAVDVLVWTAPTLSTKGLFPYQRLTNLYDLVKEIKQLVDPNNIPNPGTLYWLKQ